MNNTTQLTDLRKIIDDIDKQIVRLLNERAQAAVKIGKIKAETHTEPYDPNRERAVLDAVDALNTGPLPNGSVEDIYASIMMACREIQMGKAL